MLIRGLLAGLHGAPGDEERDTLERLTEPDWIAVADLAVQQRLAALLLHRVGQHAPTLIPDDVRGRLTTRAQHSAARVLRYQAEFKRLAQALHARGVRVTALKGIHLASDVYPSVALREMNDIDVLVDRESVETASAVAVGLGFAPLVPVPLEVSLAIDHHLPRFVKPGVGLEVHWRLTDETHDAPIDTAGVHDRSVGFSLEPTSRVLSPEDTLLHVAIHGALVHLFQVGLRPIYDVAVLIERFESRMNWTSVVQRAIEWRSSRGVGLVLGLAEKHAGARVPASVLDGLNSGRRAPSQIMDTALALCTAVVPATGKPSATFGRLLSREPLSRRIGHLARHVWCSREELMALYPEEAARVPNQLLRYRLKRARDLTGRRGPQLLALTLRRDAASREWVDRRNTVATWLRGE